MFDLFWLIPVLPLLGFLVLGLAGSRLSRPLVGTIGAGSVGLAALLAGLIGLAFITAPPPGQTLTQTLWVWFDVGGFDPAIAFHLDALSLLMTLVVTGVGFLIHLYAIEFMADDPGFSRFFAAMNLFVAMMLVLVLADNLLLLYLGWEGVGLCSFLLIGFWYSDPANARAARKAFLVTRVGDAAMAIGLFLLFAQLGTLDIQELMQTAADTWTPGSEMAIAAAGLLLAGALGKSAQLPLQVWLPDAMAGPSPVSALIHAATMVTAGVYLIARMHILFSLAPAVMLLIAVIGAATLLLAGFSALVQRDIKRVLAYSTISQIGYMFLALGVGAWSAAMFHFMTHAFFKALLFLGAGAVILAMHHDHDMFNMGGLRHQLPVTFWTFLLGAASLAALPLVTAGFYSKDLILAQTFAAPQAGLWLWAAGLLGALITGLYTFRMVFVTFFGETQRRADYHPGLLMQIPLLGLAVLSVAGGFVETPATLGGIHLFSNLMHTVLPAPEMAHLPLATELTLQLIAAGVSLAGLALAFLLYQQRSDIPARLAKSSGGAALSRFWLSGWGFDWLYDRLFVRPYVAIARANKEDNFDLLPLALAKTSSALYGWLRQTQTGRLRWYAAGIAAGAVVTIALVVLL